MILDTFTVEVETVFRKITALNIFIFVSIHLSGVTETSETSRLPPSGLRRTTQLTN